MAVISTPTGWKWPMFNIQLALKNRAAADADDRTDENERMVEEAEVRLKGTLAEWAL